VIDDATRYAEKHPTYDNLKLVVLRLNRFIEVNIEIIRLGRLCEISQEMARFLPTPNPSQEGNFVLNNAREFPLLRGDQMSAECVQVRSVYDVNSPPRRG